MRNRDDDRGRQGAWPHRDPSRHRQPRLRRGHGARNMAVVRHFAVNLVRGRTVFDLGLGWP